MRLKICYFLLCTLVTFNVHCQNWKVLTKERQSKTIIDFKIFFSPSHARNGFTFFGPTMSMNENVIHKGYDLIRNIKLTRGPQVLTKKCLCWDVSLTDNVPINPAVSSVYTNLYVENIESYSIFFSHQVNGLKRK